MKSAYRVLALRYRPQRFKELVGQELLQRILKNAFTSNRLASAFLLTGIRGVGKTTLARLLAKTMNCSDPLEEEASVEACGVCASCTAFNDGNHTDIVEVDAASYTSVDDIRRILDTCQYNPLQGKFKVFIVDEVHMLSKSAFNAFLKTLEAPPPHVKFILATTEVEKIPLTILSRCLRFDLKRIDKKVIQTHMATLCKAEKISFEDEALNLVACSAEGSLRDALSVLEQAFLLAKADTEEAGAQGATQITVALVRNVLGIKDNYLAQNALKAILANDAKAAISATRQAYEAGGDPFMFFEQLTTLVHHLSCVLVGQVEAETVFGDAEKDIMQQLADSTSLPLLGRLWQMLSKGRQELLGAAFSQRALEMLLIRLCYASQLPSPESLFGPGSKTSGSKTPDTQTSAPLPPAPAAAAPAIVPQPAPPPDTAEKKSVATAPITSTAQLLALLKTQREGLLHTHLLEDIEVLAIQNDTKQGVLKLAIQSEQMTPTVKRLQHFLEEATCQKWRFETTTQETIQSIAEAGKQETARLQKKLETHTVLKKAQELFEDLKVFKVEKENTTTMMEHAE
ncbi:MAG: DNA polymerase III subunit gamma/tau [Holosporaceae bacterium]